MADTPGNLPGSVSVTGEVAPLSPGITGTSGDVLLPSRSEVIDELVDLALDPGNPASRHTVTKWARPSVAVEVTGDPDGGTEECLAEVIADIRDLAGSLDLKIGGKANPEIKVNFIPLEEFPLRVPGSTSDSVGYTQCESRKGFLQSCTIWVPSSGVSERLRCTILRHEMTHGLGLLGHSEHAESILFQGTSADAYSPLDREVIRLLYNQALPTGFTEETVREYLS
jgi:hypothetical protein